MVYDEDPLMRRSLWCLAIAVAALQVFCVEAAGAYDDICTRSRKHTCVIPFGAVYGARHKYLGARIRVRGFLHADEEGNAILYPDRVSLRYATNEGAFWLTGISRSATEEAVRSDGKYVQVDGVVTEFEVSKPYWVELRVTRDPIDVPVAGDRPTPLSPLSDE
jgi:hypothetical protein